ncbi:IS1595 family transposase [Endozoicomonas numazuensis]|uniref:IS1595 family transposase n=1 Tax=Endozoicomonas numazuensis TaxID=1137799 RepID=UPI000692060C|nr:IS1595 family transposase [Endozoicomonas numazuensis]
MQYPLFKQFLDASSSLTRQQKNTLHRLLFEDGEYGSSRELEQTIEARFAEKPHCPHCQSLEIRRWGIRNGRQRYRCKHCEKTFNAFSGTPLTRLRHPEKWAGYLDGMTHSMTLRPAARHCDITLKTSFRWRHRFLQVIEQDQAEELSGIVELDETLFRESFKGQRSGMPRASRKRGNDKKTPCRKFPVMVARDRQSQTVDGILEATSGDQLCQHLNGRISIEAVVCADAHLAHEKLARKLGFTFKELISSEGQRVLDDIFHIQHVNAYHSHLKNWISGVFHGVATKYLHHYLGWRRRLTEARKLTVEKLTEVIVDHWVNPPLKVT